MKYRASIVNRDASLSGEFGEGFARRLFGDEAVDAMGVYSRGPRKGKPRGRIFWKKVERGGWVSDGPGEGNGHVERRVGKVIEARLVDNDGKDVRHWSLDDPANNVDRERFEHEARVREHEKFVDSMEDLIDDNFEGEEARKRYADLREVRRSFWAAEEARGFKRS